MTIIVDTSVALKWVLPEEGTEEALSLLAEDLLAPDFWLIEAANVLWRHVVAERIAMLDAIRLFQELQNVPMMVFPAEHDLSEALHLGIALRHPVYDCLYLAAAVREDAQLVTADRRFARRIQAHDKYAPYVRILGRD